VCRIRSVAPSRVTLDVSIVRQSFSNNTDRTFSINQNKFPHIVRRVRVRFVLSIRKGSTVITCVVPALRLYWSRAFSLVPRTNHSRTEVSNFRSLTSSRMFLFDEFSRVQNMYYISVKWHAAARAMTHLGLLCGLWATPLWNLKMIYKKIARNSRIHT